MIVFLAESWFHRLDPFAIQFTNDFGVRWYGLSYAAGFLIAWLMVRWFAKTNRSPLEPIAAGDLMFYIIAGVLLGGRLGYAVFYEPTLFTGVSRSFPWWDLLAINKGGMASHGGMIGAILACGLFAQRRQVPMMHLLDLVAFTAPPGLFLGRLANFVNGELWGRALPASMQSNPPGWSVKYPEEVTERWLADPSVFLPKFEALEALRGVVNDNEAFYANIVGAARDGNAAVIMVLKPLLTAYYPSQIIQALAEGPVLLALLAIVWWKPRRPGLVASWFLIIYGVLRVVTEQFRQPDVGVSLLLGLSRGQVLSLLMIVVGIASAFWCARREAEPMGGLRRPVVAGS